MSATAARIALLFAFGASYGTALDALHTHAGTFEYAHEWVFKMAVFTPLVFGCAGVSLGGLYPVAHAVTGRWPAKEIAWSTMGAALVAFVGIYAMTAFLRVSNPAKLMVTTLCAATLFVWLARTASSLVLALCGATVGPAFEAGLAHTGFLTHAHPDFAGIPMWLPGLYFCGTLTYAALGQKLFARERGG